MGCEIYKKKLKKVFFVVAILFTINYVFICATWNYIKALSLSVPDEKPSKRIHRHLPNHRMDLMVGNGIKMDFLKNFKNPCWTELNVNTTRTLCVPFYFTLGAPKCGTTDLKHRMLLHPLIASAIDSHWIARKRFSNAIKTKNILVAQPRQAKGEGHQPLSMYLKFYENTVQKYIAVNQHNGYYNTIFGDASTSTLWDNKKLLRRVFTSNMSEPPYTNADVIYDINPHAKIIAILRNPITRLYSGYLYFKRNASVLDFHRKAVSAIDMQKTCLQKNSLRFCAYFAHGEIRLHIGFYHIYLEDYMRVFPRKQIKVIRLEEYSRNISGTLKDIFNFLEIGVPSEEIMQEIRRQKRENTNNKQNHIVGKILQRTKAILYDFYKPYNDRLCELLGDNFDYNKD